MKKLLLLYCLITSCLVYSDSPKKVLCELEGNYSITYEDFRRNYFNEAVEIAKNVAVKVPLTFDGLRACKTLAEEGTSVNVTLCFSATQALLAAKAGATFISPFAGRLDDIGGVGMELISDIIEIYSNYDFKTEVLVASVRGPLHVLQAARMGADIATVPAAVIKALYKHPLTDKGLEAFISDWEKTGQSILKK